MSRLSKPIDEMTRQDCHAVARQARLKIGPELSPETWYAHNYGAQEEQRRALARGEQLTSTRDALHSAAFNAGLFRDGCVEFPDVPDAPPTLDRIAEWTVEECQLFVLANLPEKWVIATRNGACGAAPLFVGPFGGDKDIHRVGDPGTAATLTDWRKAAALVHAEKYPEPKRIVDMTLEECVLALDELPVKWDYSVGQCAKGEQRAYCWRLSGKQWYTTGFSDPGGPEEWAVKAQHAVRGAAREVSRCNEETDTIKPEEPA